jgi:O-antigen/teichoic acid export membrane protein
LLPGECGAGEVAAAVAVMSLEAAIAVPLAWLRMRDRVAAFCALTLGRVALQAALVAAAAYTGAGVAGVLAGTATAACLQAALLGYLHIADAGLRRDRELVRLAGTYAMPIVGAGLLAFALAGLDRWLLATLEGTETVAAYGVAARFALAAVLLMQPFSMWWTPRRFTVLFGEDGVRRAARVITAALCLLCVVVLASAAAGPLLIGWLLPGTYAGAERLLLWLLLAMALKEAAELLSIGCLAGRSSRRLLRAELLSALIAVLTAVPLVATYGAEGAACTVLIAQAARLYLVVRFGAAVRPLPLPGASLAAIAAATAALAIAMQQLSAPWWRIAFAAAAMAGVGIAAVRLIPLPAPSLATRRPGAVTG